MPVFRQALNEAKKQNHTLIERLQTMQNEVSEGEVRCSELEGQIRQSNNVRVFHILLLLVLVGDCGGDLLVFVGGCGGDLLVFVGGCGGDLLVLVGDCGGDLLVFVGGCGGDLLVFVGGCGGDLLVFVGGCGGDHLLAFVGGCGGDLLLLRLCHLLDQCRPANPSTLNIIDCSCLLPGRTVQVVFFDHLHTQKHQLTSSAGRLLLNGHFIM